MLSGERTEAIKEILSQKRSVSVADLSRKLSVSPSTIRRDLKLLESAYCLRRTHGGAIPWEASFYSDLEEGKESYREISKVAKLAFSLIKPKDSIYLDGGSITLSLARLLKNDLNVGVITNSLKIAMELAARGNINLSLTGGNLKLPEFTLQGPLTEVTLNRLHVNKAFLDGVSLDFDKGLTTDDLLGAQMKAMMIKKADKTFVLATAKHFGQVSFASVCPLAEVHSIVTNRRLSNKIMNQLHRYKVSVRWG